MKKLLISLTAATALVACKKDDKPQPKEVFYAQTYLIHWMMDDKTTRIDGRITASENGYNRLSADDQSIFSINGLKFAPSKSSGDDKVGTSFLGLVGADFILYKGDGNKIKNKVAANNIGYADFPSGFPDEISKSKEFSFEWIGTLPIEEGDNVILFIHKTDDITTGIYKQFDQRYDSKVITLTKEEIAVLPIGDVVAELKREGKPRDLPNKDNVATAQVSISSYASRKVKVVN